MMSSIGILSFESISDGGDIPKPSFVIFFVFFLLGSRELRIAISSIDSSTSKIKRTWRCSE